MHLRISDFVCAGFSLRTILVIGVKYSSPELCSSVIPVILFCWWIFIMCLCGCIQHKDHLPCLIFSYTCVSNSQSTRKYCSHNYQFQRLILLKVISSIYADALFTSYQCFFYTILTLPNTIPTLAEHYPKNNFTFCRRF